MNIDLSLLRAIADFPITNEKENQDAVAMRDIARLAIDEEYCGRITIIDRLVNVLRPFAAIAEMKKGAEPNASVFVNIERCRDAKEVLEELISATLIAIKEHTENKAVTDILEYFERTEPPTGMVAELVVEVRRLRSILETVSLHSNESDHRICATCNAVLADGPQPLATYEKRD